MLEAIDRGPAPTRTRCRCFRARRLARRVCWDDGFLDFFADAGYRAAAMSLRGHGTSPTN
jgi:hypothetical protein